MADNTTASSYGLGNKPDSYDMPARFPQNPYGVEPSATVVATSKQEAPSIFANKPFHDFLAENSEKLFKKKAWELNDDQIKSAVNDYFDTTNDDPKKWGAGAQAIARHEAETNKHTSADSLKTHVNFRLPGISNEVANQVSQSLPDIKAHFAGLKPQGAATEPPVTSDDNFANSLQRAGLDIERGAAIPAGNVLSALSPLAGNKATLGSPLAFLSAFQSPEHAQATAESMFKAADAAKEQADKLPHDPSVKGRLVEGLTDFAASLPTGAAQYVSNAYQDAVKEGKPQFNAWVDALKQAGTIAMGLGVGRVAGRFENPLTRRGVGAVGGAAIPATGNVLSGQPIDPVQAAIGGAAGALSASPRSEVNVKAKEGGTPEAATGAEPTQAPVQGSAPANEGGAVSATPRLSETTQGVLDDALDKLHDTHDPAKARALYDEMLSSVPEEERPAFATSFANDWADAAPGRDPAELGLGQKATPEEEALAAEVSPQESPQATPVAEAKQPVSPIESRQTPLSKPKVIDASQFTLEHLDDARKYHATQDITEKGNIVKKMMKDTNLPKADIRAFIEAVKEAKGPKVKPR